MLLMPKKKSIASIIVGKMRPSFVQGIDDPKHGSPVSLPEDDDSVGLEAAMDKFLVGVEAKDTKKMADALEDFLAMCKREDD